MWRLVEIAIAVAIAGVVVTEFVHTSRRLRAGMTRVGWGHLLVALGCSWWVVDIVMGRERGGSGVAIDALSYVAVLIGISFVAPFEMKPNAGSFSRKLK